jgi:hypothetical protein
MPRVRRHLGAGAHTTDMSLQLLKIISHKSKRVNRASASPRLFVFDEHERSPGEVAVMRINGWSWMERCYCFSSFHPASSKQTHSPGKSLISGTRVLALSKRTS